MFLVSVGNKYKDKETMRNEWKKQYETSFAAWKKKELKEKTVKKKRIKKKLKTPSQFQQLLKNDMNAIKKKINRLVNNYLKTWIGRHTKKSNLKDSSCT